MKHNLYWNCKEGENCYKDQVLPNWNVFNECFAGTNIKISDVDGVVERNGLFLFMQKWFLTIALLTNAKKSLSSCQLARDLE